MNNISGHGRTHRRALAFTIIGISLLFGLVACSSADDRSASTGKAPAIEKQDAAGQNAAAAPAGAAADKAKAGGTAEGGTAVIPLQTGSERAIIYTGTMTVAVPASDVDGTATKVSTLATGSGGYVGADQRLSSGDNARATLTVRVPVENFSRVVDAIGALGKEKDRQISAEDVTAKLVDVTARLKTQQASVDRIRALMSQAKSITDVTTLESELSRREADLESLEAQQRDLTNLTAMSTITVSVVAEGAPAPAPKKPDNGFVAGLKSGWHAFAVSCRALLTVLGALLPFAVVIGVLTWLVLYVDRRRRLRRRNGFAAQPPTQLPPPLPMPTPVPVPTQPQRTTGPVQS